MKITKYQIIVGKFNLSLDCMDWEDYEYDTRAEQIAMAEKYEKQGCRVKLSEKTIESDKSERVLLRVVFILMGLSLILFGYVCDKQRPMARIGETAINAGLCEQLDDGYKCVTIDGGMVFGKE